MEDFPCHVIISLYVRVFIQSLEVLNLKLLEKIFHSVILSDSCLPRTLCALENGLCSPAPPAIASLDAGM